MRPSAVGLAASATEASPGMKSEEVEEQREPGEDWAAWEA